MGRNFQGSSPSGSSKEAKPLELVKALCRVKRSTWGRGWVVWVDGSRRVGEGLSPFLFGEISENTTDHILEKILLKERSNQMLKLSFVWGLKKHLIYSSIPARNIEHICMETSHWEIFNSTVNSEIANQSIIDRIFSVLDTTLPTTHSSNSTYGVDLSRHLQQLWISKWIIQDIPRHHRIKSQESTPWGKQSKIGHIRSSTKRTRYVWAFW